MRVLALVTDAFGGYGGIAQYNRDLLAALAGLAETDRIDVLPRLAPDPLGPLPAKVVQHRPRASRLALGLSAFRIAVALQPDVVFCGHLHLAPLAAVIARWRRARLVIQAHGVEVWSPPSRVRMRGLDAADLVLCVSRDTRARVLTWSNLPPERVRVAPNTVGAAFTPGDGQAMRRRFGVQRGKVILSVSRLDAGQRHKGQDRVIRALPRLLSQGHDVVYLVVGAGDDIPRLQALAASQGVAERVRFLGRVPAEELPDVYRAADLFALPSTRDGFGIVFLEAMACGVPALGLAAGGAVDALADGVLVSATDRDGLADALGAALGRRRPDPQRLAAAVRGRFGPDRFQRRIHAAFTSPAPAQTNIPASLRSR